VNTATAKMKYEKHPGSDLDHDMEER